MSPTILFIWVTSASKGAGFTFPGGDNSFVVVVCTQGHFVCVVEPGGDFWNQGHHG